MEEEAFFKIDASTLQPPTLGQGMMWHFHALWSDHPGNSEFLGEDALCIRLLVRSYPMVLRAYSCLWAEKWSLGCLGAIYGAGEEGHLASSMQGTCFTSLSLSAFFVSLSLSLSLSHLGFLTGCQAFLSIGWVKGEPGSQVCCPINSISSTCSKSKGVSRYFPNCLFDKGSSRAQPVRHRQQGAHIEFILDLFDFHAFDIFS